MAEFEIIAPARAAPNLGEDVIYGGPQMSAASSLHYGSSHAPAAQVAKAALFDEHLLFDHGTIFDVRCHFNLFAQWNMLL